MFHLNIININQLLSLELPLFHMFFRLRILPAFLLGGKIRVVKMINAL